MSFPFTQARLIRGNLETQKSAEICLEYTHIVRKSIVELFDTSIGTSELIELALSERPTKFSVSGKEVLCNRLTSEVFEKCRLLLSSRSAAERELAVLVLGRFGSVNSKLKRTAIRSILKKLENESSVRVISQIGWSLHGLKTKQGSRFFATLVAHPSSKVRFGVVGALLGINEEYAVQALCRLTADQDREVRNWATYAIGSGIDSHSKAIRKALWARLGDTDDEIKCEAIWGLAKRKDARVVPFVLQLLKEHGCFTPTLEAAASLASSVLLDELLNIEKSGCDNEVLAAAIDACR